jgi:organic hydroperoxide reductase OsmC/OhrA
MSEHTINVRWSRGATLPSDFVGKRYMRNHEWTLDSGVVLAAAASPHVVPLPWTNPMGIDPEEAFVASIASCHMLWFLAGCAQRGHVVDRYDDDPVGMLAKNAHGRLAMTSVTLRPKVSFVDDVDAATLADLHHEAHEACFIASSVNCTITVEPRA